jgi:DNA-binding response OmpR family regulator
MSNNDLKGLILLVDDEPVVLDVGTLMLEKLGFKVLQATNGTQASQIFKENKASISLVILDIKQPDELGSETCKRLKRIKKDVNVLHTSGLSGTLSGARLECGCDGFLSKPFKIGELSNKLTDALANTNKINPISEVKSSKVQGTKTISMSDS